MKIIVPTTGAELGQRTVGFVVNIAKRLEAKLLVLRILSEKEAAQEGEETLSLFKENGKTAKVPVNGILCRLGGIGDNFWPAGSIEQA